jgi:hypothetical protein
LTFISLPSVGTLTHDVGNFLTANPALIHEVAGHALAHALFSHMRRGRSKRISRRQSRKSANRKRRWFVDNIIMHHKRLHDRNREMVITNARTRALARRKELEKKPQIAKTSLQHNRSPHVLLRNKIDLKSRGEEMRSISRAKKLRAESRWASLVRGQQGSGNLSGSGNSS